MDLARELELICRLYLSIYFNLLLSCFSPTGWTCYLLLRALYSLSEALRCLRAISAVLVGVEYWLYDLIIDHASCQSGCWLMRLMSASMPQSGFECCKWASISYLIASVDVCLVVSCVCQLWSDELLWRVGSFYARRRPYRASEALIWASVQDFDAKSVWHDLCSPFPILGIVITASIASIAIYMLPVDGNSRC